MAQITLEDTLKALEDETDKYEITLEADMIEKARASIDRMLEIK